MQKLHWKRSDDALSLESLTDTALSAGNEGVEIKLTQIHTLLLLNGVRRHHLITALQPS